MNDVVRTAQAVLWEVLADGARISVLDGQGAPLASERIGNSPFDRFDVLPVSDPRALRYRALRDEASARARTLARRHGVAPERIVRAGAGERAAA